MTSESPTENKDYFNFGRSTPPPTTSFMARIGYEGSSSTATDSTALLELKKDTEKDKDADGEKDKEDKEDKDKEKEEHAMGPGENPGEKKNNECIKREDGDKRDDKGEKDRKSKDYDKIPNGDYPQDWKSTVDGKIDEEQEDDNCIVKCLYYTMQCCECTIS